MVVFQPKNETQISGQNIYMESAPTSIPSTLFISLIFNALVVSLIAKMKLFALFLCFY